MNDILNLNDKRLANYLYDNCSDEIYNAASRYLCSSDYTVSDIYIKHTNLETLPNLDVKGYLAADVYIEGPCSKEEIHKYVYMTFTFDMDNIVDTFKIIYVDDSYDKSKCFCRNDFVPVIRKSKMKYFVDKIYQDYYKDIYSIGYVDATVIATNMGLNIKYGRLSPNLSIFGLICMNDVDVPLYNDDGTILSVEHAHSGDIFIDKDANYFCAGNNNKENFTIMHECIHWYLHRKYFKFLEILKLGNNKEFKCNVDFLSINNDDIKWLEWQASSMASLVLLPEELLLPKYEEVVADYKALGYESAFTMSLVVDKLSNYFHVSHEVIKIRLNELGKDVVGIYEYVDNGYVKTYSYKHNYLKDKQTFSMNYRDMFNAIKLNPKLYSLLDEGKLVIVDHHIIKNDKKYVSFKNGRFILTNYALNHMDECALVFEYEINGIHESTLYRTYILCNEITNKTNVKISVLVDGVDIKDKPQLVNDLYKYEVELLGVMSNKDFGESLRSLLKYKDMTQTSLSDITGIPRETISRYISNNSEKHKKSYIIAICAALNLPYRVSTELMNRAGIVLSTATPTDIMIAKLLMYCYNLEFEEFRDLYENVTGENMISSSDY